MYLIVDDFDSRREDTPITTFSGLSDSLNLTTNGNYDIDSAYFGFNTRKYDISLFIKTKEKLSKVKGKIVKQETQRFTFGDNPNHHHFGKIIGVKEKHIASEYYELSLEIELEPFAYLKDRTISVSGNGTVENLGNVQAEPKIKVFGNGTGASLVVGDYVLKVDVSGSLTIDCTRKKVNVYDQNGKLANHRMSGDFPKLKTGINGITMGGGISRIEIEMMERVI
ncbi:MAG: hypothetical protein ACRC1D_04155 [Culicoidibacterales bacterium]